MISVEHLTRVFERGAVSLRALDDVSVRIAPGEFVAVTGPSGSGKSTFLNILGLTDRPSGGVVDLGTGAVDFSDEDALVHLRRTALGYIFQSFNLLSALTARENVAVSLILQGVRYGEAIERAEAVLTRLGLKARSEHLPYELSGGEMQRVAIARALVHAPGLIIADEPTGNLDSANGGVVLEILKDIAREGRTVVMATHSEAAVAMCDRAIELRDGRVKR